MTNTISRPVSKLQKFSTVLIYSLSGLAIILGLTFPLVASWLAFEDGPAETLSTLFLFAASFCMVWHAVRLYKTNMRLLAALSLIIALAFFVFGGEEISWGQRIFGIETGEFLQEHNWQGETNFHNLHTDLSNTLYHIGAFSFLIVLPLFKRQFSKLFDSLRLSTLKHFIAPKWLAIPSFVIIAMLDPRYLTHIEKPTVATIFLIIFVIGSILLLQQLYKAYQAKDSRGLLLINISVVLVVLGMIASAYFDNRVGFSPNTLAEFKELIIAIGLFTFAAELLNRPSSTVSSKSTS